MPAKGSHFVYSGRDYIFNREFYKNVLSKEETLNLTYAECKNIIEHSNHVITDVVKNELDGFKMPFGLGYLCASRFIPKNLAIDWKKTKEIGKRVYHLNFHTNGYSCRVNWFRVGRINVTSFNEVFKFKAYKTFSQLISKAFKEGKNYLDWTCADYIEKSRLENLYNKKYRKEIKKDG